MELQNAVTKGAYFMAKTNKLLHDIEELTAKKNEELKILRDRKDDLRDSLANLLRDAVVMKNDLIMLNLFLMTDQDLLEKYAEFVEDFENDNI